MRSLLIDRDAIFKVVDLLGKGGVYLARHQRIYGTVQALLERRERIDPLTVQIELARREELDRVGGPAYLRELTELVPTAVEIERHARIVRERAIRPAFSARRRRSRPTHTESPRTYRSYSIAPSNASSRCATNPRTRSSGTS